MITGVPGVLVRSRSSILRPLSASFWFALVAAATMTVDHLGHVLGWGEPWSWLVGRVAMPFFAVGVGRGLVLTRDSGRYALRLAWVALAAQGPYWLAFWPSASADICLTFAVVVLAVTLARSPWWPLSWLPLCAVPLVEYGWPVAVMVLVAWHVERGAWWWLPIGLVAAALSNGLDRLAVWPVVVGAYLLALCWPRGVAGHGRWLYWYYPGHLAILGLISSLSLI